MRSLKSAGCDRGGDYRGGCRSVKTPAEDDEFASVPAGRMRLSAAISPLGDRSLPAVDFSNEQRVAGRNGEVPPCPAERLVSNSPKEERSRSRIGCWLIGFLILNLAVFGRLAMFWHLSEPNRQLVVGPTTTAIDGPLTADGYVDYVAALNQRMSDGVTTENNAVPLLIRAYGPQIIADDRAPMYFDLLGVPRPAAGGPFLVGEGNFVQRTATNEAAIQQFHEVCETARKRPWTRGEFPDIAAMLDGNAAPLELLVQASRRPRYYSPSVSLGDPSPMYGVLLPVEQEQREAARQLTLRAMLKLGEGDAQGAWADLHACHRLARMTGQSPFYIGALVCVAIDAITFQSDAALIASQTLTAEQARQCVRDVRELAPLPSMADLLDNSERWGLLDATIQIARNPDAMQTMSGSSANAPMMSGAIDWNVALQVVNEEVDKTVVALREPDLRKRLAELDSLGNAPRGRGASAWAIGLRSFLGNRESASRQMGWVMLKAFQPGTRSVAIAETRAIARERVLLAGFALAAFRGEHGAYPELLAELVPSVLAEVPLDPCSGKDLVYRRTADGFVLYSVGDDMQDNGGTPLDSRQGNQPFDIVLRVGSE